jgi:carbon storage regulator CsrA
MVAEILHAGKLKGIRMLILQRKKHETIDITTKDGTLIQVTVMAIQGPNVRLGIKAPDNVVIDRHEVTVEKERESN